MHQTYQFFLLISLASQNDLDINFPDILLICNAMPKPYIKNIQLLFDLRVSLESGAGFMQPLA